MRSTRFYIGLYAALFVADIMATVLLYGLAFWLLVHCIGCAGTGGHYISSGAVVETQRANDALQQQQQWQTWQIQQQQQQQRNNDAWRPGRKTWN